MVLFYMIPIPLGDSIKNVECCHVTTILSRNSMAPCSIRPGQVSWNPHYVVPCTIPWNHVIEFYDLPSPLLFGTRTIVYQRSCVVPTLFD